MSDETLIQFVGSPKPPGSGQSEQPALFEAKCPSCGQRFGAQGKFCPFCGDALLQVEASAIEPSVELSPGLVIDERYRIEKMLGSGGMGAVYEVTHTLLQRRMALKVLRPELAGLDDLSARFLREARAAAAIEHPNVVRISDFGTLASGQAYFVMELLSGMPLRSLVASGRIAADRVAAITRQIADGLSAAHRAGIVHRDLKPDNIHVDPKAGDFVKVLDFGLARVAGASRLTKQGIVFGTPQYMSPEQAAGENVDHRSDVYSLGVMMYEMLTGSVPFESDTYMGVLTKHLRWPPLPLNRFVDPSLLGGLEPIVLRALEKSPDQRFSNMVELMHALDQRQASSVERRVFGLRSRRSAESMRHSEPDALRVPGLASAPSARELSRLILPAGLGATVAAVAVAFALGGPKKEDVSAPEVTATQAAVSAIVPQGGTPVATTESAPSPALPSAAPSAAGNAPTANTVPANPAPANSAPPLATSVSKADAPSHKVSQSVRPAVTASPSPTTESAPSEQPKRKKRVSSEIIDPWADD